MDCNTFYKSLKLDYELIQKSGFNPYYPAIQSGLGDPIIIEGKEFINLASNNYLGLAYDERVIEASVSALRKYGASMCATPVASGYPDFYKQVESRLSRFLNLEGILIYPSCYQANNGIFSALVQKEDMVIIDHYAHSSLIEGIRSAGCTIRPFLHNNMNSLEKILQRSANKRQVFVITESVFSTEGAIAPFRQIVDLCDKYHAIPVIDDSHGIGVLGKQGRGILEHEGIKDYQGIYTASLGKALANTGGVVGGRKILIDYLKYYSSHLVYSTAITPSALGGIDMVLDIIENEFSVRSKKMWEYKYRISEALKKNGFKITDSKTPISSIMGGSSLETILISKELYENRILSTPFVYPSVPPYGGKIRLIAGANLKQESIDYAVHAFETIQIKA
jgi:7-keto-8-aminopelargonate synthetase-like enzyme